MIKLGIIVWTRGVGSLKAATLRYGLSDLAVSTPHPGSGVIDHSITLGSVQLLLGSVQLLLDSVPTSVDK